MASLFEINEAIENCFVEVETGDVVDMTTGEIFDEGYLEELFADREQKVKNIVLYIKNLTAEAEAVKQQKMNFARRQARLEKRVESLKDYLSRNLAAGEKYNAPEFTLGWRKTESVEVSDIHLLEADGFDEYLTYKAPEPKKADIKKALKAGKTIPGCSLVASNKIQIK